MIYIFNALPEDTDAPLDGRKKYTSFSHRNCWLAWWQGEQCTGIMQVAVQHEITPGRTETLKNYILWLREMGWDARLTHHQGSNIPVSDDDWVSSTTPVYSVDIPFRLTDPGNKVFIGFNFARFVAGEPRKDLPEHATAEGVFEWLFCKWPVNTNHLPFIDSGSLYAYAWSRKVGRDLFAWFSEILPVLPASKPMNEERGPSSGLYFKEFKSWLSERSIIEAKEHARKVHSNDHHSWDRPRDSRGRFVKREIDSEGTAAAPTQYANARLFRSAADIAGDGYTATESWRRWS